MTSPDEPPTQPQPEKPARRRLTRSSSDRWIGGVASGLAHHLGIDPIIVRIGFVVLTFISGIGLLIYLALLAFVPSDDGTSLGGGNRIPAAAAAAALVVLTLIFLGPPAVLFGPGILVLALLAVVVVLALRAVGDTGDPARTAARVGLICLAVLAGLGAAVGVGFVAALGGGTAIGILTVVTGLALVATAFLGGARWLIAPALVLALPLAVVAAADIDIKGGIGSREYRPASLAQVQPGYRLGMGDLAVDLRDVELPAGPTDLKIDLGVGHARVDVADDVCVTSDVHVGAGAVSMFDHVNDGVDVAFAEGAAPKPGQPVLHVVADLGMGALEVGRHGSMSGFPPNGEVACP